MTIRLGEMVKLWYRIETLVVLIFGFLFLDNSPKISTNGLELCFLILFSRSGLTASHLYAFVMVIFWLKWSPLILCIDIFLLQIIFSNIAFHRAFLTTPFKNYAPFKNLSLILALFL